MFSGIRKAFIKKKSVTFLHSGLTPPPYFPESVTKIQKKKAFKMQYYAILDNVFEKKSVTKTGPDPPPNVKNVKLFGRLP